MSRVKGNLEKNILTNLLLDTNTLIDMDDAADDQFDSSDATLRIFGLLEWVEFLRDLDAKKLPYVISSYFGLDEMPASLATHRALRLAKFARKFGILWVGDKDEIIEAEELGKTSAKYTDLSFNNQVFLAISYASLLLAQIVKRDGDAFSAIGRFTRYLSLHRQHIGVCSIRELAIARYIFATPDDCPGQLNERRAAIEKNFARKKGKHAKSNDEMLEIALNGAFDLRLFTAMNVAETNGLEGVKQDCWLITKDEKLVAYNEVCFNTGFGVDDVGQYVALDKHELSAQYWKDSAAKLARYASQGEQRVVRQKQLELGGVDLSEERKKILAGLPAKALSVMELVRTGI